MLTHLSCFLCGKEYDAKIPQNLCECGRPLNANYDIGPSTLQKDCLKDREPTMWRYREVMPSCESVTLGEGFTPLLHTPSLGERWYVKDEAVNPTASFKARGMSTAVSMAKHFGLKKLAVPSAGNAGGALSAYAARAGIKAYIYVPKDTPKACVLEVKVHGAHLTLWDGLISDCGAEIARVKEQNGWFDVSTLKEPYRLEGKKTMGYEIAEQMEWELPDVIIYATGGGTGYVGMWKAFDEMERMGWIGSKRPRMVSVQAEGCAVIKPAFDQGTQFAEPVKNAFTVASGLRVPKAVGDFIILDILKKSGGRAITITDEVMVQDALEMSAKTGVYASPEGGATLSAAKQLRDEGYIKDTDRVVMFNTGSGVKYMEAFSG